MIDDVVNEIKKEINYQIKFNTSQILLSLKKDLADKRQKVKTEKSYPQTAVLWEDIVVLIGKYFDTLDNH